MRAVAIIARAPEVRTQLEELLVLAGLEVRSITWDAAQTPSEVDAVVVVCPAGDPVPTLREASALLPRPSHIAVLPTVNRHTVRRSVRAGAAAVVRLSAVEECLVLAVRGACAGQLSVPLDVAAGLEKPLLSSRERQILGMVVMGYTNKQIAQRLFLAESTVKSHLSAVFAKLGVRSRKEASALILDPDEGLGMGVLGISEGGLAPVTAASELTGQAA